MTLLKKTSKKPKELEVGLTISLDNLKLESSACAAVRPANKTSSSAMAERPREPDTFSINVQRYSYNHA